MSGHAGQPDYPSAATTARPGKGFHIGEYTILDTLGHGSMAAVFLARDATGHDVALKIFQEGPGVSPTMLERFRREAEASKKLRRHPQIMKVYATGQEGPYHFIVMEPIRNSRTLEDLVESGELDRDAILRIGAKIARALHYAHTRNIVHRDVKPSNIMIDEFGEPLLTDFGVAALIDWPACTLSGALTGTPLYMSPEQARAERVGPASDIYSLGVVLYEALTGMLPYTSQHAAPVKAVLEAVKNEVPRRPRFYRKDLSQDVEAVILKALEKEPKRRYADAESMASDLERARTGRSVTARLGTATTRLTQFVRRHDQLFAAALVVLLILGGAGWFFRQQLLRARYEKLLTAVHLRNFVQRVTGQTGGEAAATPGAWHDLRTARRAMQSGNWPGARTGLEAAADQARAVGDLRTAAIANLDLARTLLMLGDAPGALASYKAILANPDAPPPVLDQAHLEALMLALLESRPPDAVALLQARALPAYGPVREAIRCLAGELDARALADRVAGMPARQRNDALLALALRHRIDGEADQYRTILRQTLQASSPASEWPGPLARLLLGEVRH